MLTVKYYPNCRLGIIFQLAIQFIMLLFYLIFLLDTIFSYLYHREELFNNM